jgi:hypothetical protein
LKKSFAKFNKSFNASFQTVLSTWKSKDDKSSFTDVAVVELKRKEQTGDGRHAEALFSSEAFDSLYTLGEEVRCIAFCCIRS